MVTMEIFILKVSQQDSALISSYYAYFSKAKTFLLLLEKISRFFFFTLAV